MKWVFKIKGINGQTQEIPGLTEGSVSMSSLYSLKQGLNVRKERTGSERVDQVSATKNLTARLRNMYFITFNNKFIRIYEFRHDRNKAWSYTLGCPTRQQYANGLKGDYPNNLVKKWFGGPDFRGGGMQKWK